jgi:RNA recognition motif-containing protein
MLIHLANLSPTVDEQQVAELFARFGAVLSLELKWRRYLGRITGTAIIEMFTADALTAINSLKGLRLQRRRLYITPMLENRVRSAPAARAVLAWELARRNNAGRVFP